MAITIYLSNDHRLTLDGLFAAIYGGSVQHPTATDEQGNALEGEWVNDATVAVTITDRDGAQVSGETWPLTLAYVTASNGRYQAVLDDGLSLSEKCPYFAAVTVDDTTNNLQAQIRLKLQAEVRDA